MDEKADPTNLEENANAENGTYIFLDFNGKLPSESLEEKTFLRIANLHKEHPLIQVNDLVFKGKYDYSIGTNLFFEKCDGLESPALSVFEKKPAKFVISQSKVIHFKQARISTRKSDIPFNKHNINYNLDWDYNELLKQFEQGSLDLKQLVKSQDNDIENEDDGVTKKIPEKEQIVTEHVDNMDTHEFESLLVKKAPVEKTEKHKSLEWEYMKLQMLARQPMRTKTISEVVSVSAYQDIYEYKSVECKVLQPPLFKTSIIGLCEETLWQFIDLNRCCTIGLISLSNDFPRKLTDYEKQKILTLENFDNLSLPVRLIVLKAQIEKLEVHIEKLQEQDLIKVDEYGRQPQETLKFYKKLVMSLQRKLKQISETTNE
ncbi:uncharacterized protein LOC132700949 [Cylas formicarius]|uniref:uncharacterized protein LOC132700949 n=1 Tax=Cylas formicarius TaxID=197179 RepID=UPI0029588513|nr:uncharacterized protein LOC132700949 [Cylas formicarius]